jgi:hypothetical protein
MKLFLHILIIILFIPGIIGYVSEMKKTKTVEKRKIIFDTIEFVCICHLIIFQILSIIDILFINPKI